MSFGYDIETAPLTPNIEAMFERQEFVDKQLDLSQWKKPETREAKAKEWADTTNDRVRAHEEAENKRHQDFVDKSTLRAERSRVLCISYHFPHGDPLRGEGRVGSDPSLFQTGDTIVEWGPERELLSRLWLRAYRTQNQNGRMYSVSGKYFDVRFPWRRSIIQGVEIPTCCRVIQFRGARPFVHESFVDVADVWAAGEYGNYIKAQHLAIAMGVEGKWLEEGVTGGNFWKIADEDREKAERYAKRDAQIAWELGRKLELCGIWPMRSEPAAV